jgi:hypothetical protein
MFAQRVGAEVMALAARRKMLDRSHEINTGSRSLSTLQAEQFHGAAVLPRPFSNLHLSTWRSTLSWHFVSRLAAFLSILPKLFAKRNDVFEVPPGSSREAHVKGAGVAENRVVQEPVQQLVKCPQDRL